MAKHNEFGRLGEEIAARYLTEKGYTILERNWRNVHKEIDIIAKDGEEKFQEWSSLYSNYSPPICSGKDWMSTPVSTSFPS